MFISELKNYPIFFDYFYLKPRIEYSLHCSKLQS
jgi:hypothetical protein